MSSAAPSFRPPEVLCNTRVAHRSGDHVRVELSGVGHAQLRPLRGGEVEPLLAVFDRMSPVSRNSRFLAPMPRLTRGMVEALVAVDGHRHVAWLASVSDSPAGLARYLRTGPSTAEIALEVVDAYQGRGLGTALLDAVTTLASVNGIRRIHATVLAGNEPARLLVTRIGVPLTWSGPALEGEGPLRLLEPPRVDRSAVVALAARTRSAAGPDEPRTSA